MTGGPDMNRLETELRKQARKRRGEELLLVLAVALMVLGLALLTDSWRAAAGAGLLIVGIPAIAWALWQMSKTRWP